MDQIPQETRGLPTTKRGLRQHSLALTESIVATVRGPLLVLDEALRIVFVNDAFLECFRLDRDEAEGASLVELADGQWDVPELRERLAEVIPSGSEIRGFELSVDLAGFGRRVLLLNACKLRSTSGVLKLCLLAMEDVTQWREELSGAHQNLEQALTRHRVTEEQLFHANRLNTVGRLTAGLAHELGTPLNVIMARAQLIQRGLSSGAAVVKDVAIMEEQAQKMATLIRNVLDFAGKRRQSQTTILRSLIEKTLEALQPLARKSRVALLDQKGPAGLLVSCDANALQQVLSNLIVNAIDAQPDGGVVRVGFQEAAGAARQGSFVELRVEDEGVGIPKELLEDIFAPFFTTKPEGRGTGLGLSVSRELVEQQGGWIEVESQPGRGAQFSAVLPCEQPKEKR